jgi:hypothetical protein
MKRNVLISVLLVSMFACPAALSQEFEPEDMELKMQMRQREMELKQRESKMDMEREMMRLDIDQRKMELEREHKDDGRGVLGLILLICVIVHILLAVWIYMDIRQLNRGSGIWIVIALLTGLMGALVYAIVRLGDGRQKGS